MKSNNSIFISVGVIIAVLFIILVLTASKKLKKFKEEAHKKVDDLLASNKITQSDYEKLKQNLGTNNFRKDKFEIYLKNAIESKVISDNSQKLREEKRAYLIKKYGEDIANKLLRNEYWIGMTKDQVIDSKGEPSKIETEVLKTKTKETFIYGSKSGGDYFVFENDLVTKYVDR